jgi:hypothetical protein
MPHETKRVSLLLALGIFIFPVIAAWALLGSGYSTRARLVGFGWLFLIVAVVIISLSTASNIVVPPTAPASKADSDQPHIISASEFDGLQPGLMTYSFVAGLFGPGELQSSSNAGGIKTENYFWSNPDGSNMSLIFQNDRLVMKTQSGLQ